MNYLLLALVIGVLVWLAAKWMDYRKAVRSSDGYAKRRIFALLFLAFMSFISITSIFADALFEFLGLHKPAQFEWMAFGAFAVLSIAGVLIANGDKNRAAGKKVVQKSEGKKARNIHTEGPYIEKQIIQKSSGTGKKKSAKELTPLHTVNPADIVGRGKDLEELHGLLFDNKKVVVVNGLGGIGKTTLAEAYAFKYYDSYKHMAWVTQNAEKLTDDFAQNAGLIQNLHIETAGKKSPAIFQEILNGLRGCTKGPNLLVIDNALSSVETHLHLLPGQPNWHLLVTSRQQIAGLHPKELGFLTPADAVLLFKKHCTLITDETQIADLVKTVGYHTLTIEILAKTAQRQRPDVTQLKRAIGDDLKANVKTKHSHLQKIEKITSYLSSIFDLSGLTAAEAWLMKQFACLPPEFHPWERLKAWLPGEDGEKTNNLADTLAALHEKGWLLRSKNGGSYKMHRIIAEVAARKLAITPDDVAPLVESVTGLLSIDQTKDNPVDKFQWVPFGEAILKHFPESESPAIARLQNNLATVLQDLGDFAGAKELLEKALRSAEKNFGPDHPTTAVSYSNLALVLQDLGDFAGAKELLEKALRSAEKNFGPDHPTTAVRYSNLATVLQDLGDFAGAKELLEKALRSDEKTSAPTIPPPP